MKHLAIISVCLSTVAMIACSDIKRKPGKIYMPDMAYSRAVETYSDHRELQAEGINYTARPVVGTVSRSEDVIYKMLADTTAILCQLWIRQRRWKPSDSTLSIAVFAMAPNSMVTVRFTKAAMDHTLQNRLR
jgi:hypothetical protein